MKIAGAAAGLAALAARASALLSLSQHLCASNQGPLTRYLLSFQMTYLALACLEALLAFIRAN